MTKTRFRWVLLAAACAAVAAAVYLLPLREHFIAFVEWAKGLGPWGPAVLALAYIPACVLLFPASLLTLAAGFAFGVVRGTIAVSLGSILGVSAAFLLGRTLARGLVEKKLARHPRFRALDAAVARHGARIVLLTRLSPVIPFNVLNYAFSLTSVRFRDYFLASWIGMLPGTVLYVYLGSAAMNLADLASGKVEGGAAQRVLFFIGLAATAAATIFVTLIARQALASAVKEDGPGAATCQALQGAAHD